METKNTSSVAHDSNNLLAVSLGYAHSLRDDLTEILKAAEHGRSITRQLLAFSCRQILTPVTRDLNEVLQDLIPLLQNAMGEIVTLIACPSPKTTRVSVDEEQLTQCC